MGLAICIIGIVFSAVYAIYRLGKETFGTSFGGIIYIAMGIAILAICGTGGMMLYGLVDAAVELSFWEVNGLKVGLGIIIAIVGCILAVCNMLLNKKRKKEEELEKKAERRELARTFLQSAHEERIRAEVNQMEPTHGDIGSIALKHYVYCTYYRLSDAQKEEYTQEWREEKIQQKLRELYLKEIPNDEDVERVIAKYGAETSSQDGEFPGATNK